MSDNVTTDASAVKSQNLSGDLGEPRTTIDLSKPGDLNLIHRAVVNGWNVPQHVRSQIVEQIGPALAHYNSTHKFRDVKKVIKLVKLAQLMGLSDDIPAGRRKSLHPFARKRYPEKRRPRKMRTAASSPPFRSESDSDEQCERSTP